MPMASWITTTQGHGPAPDGVANMSGIAKNGGNAHFDHRFPRRRVDPEVCPAAQTRRTGRSRCGSRPVRRVASGGPKRKHKALVRADGTKDTSRPHKSSSRKAAANLAAVLAQQLNARRAGRTRTGGLRVPNAARYQAAPQPVHRKFSGLRPPCRGLRCAGGRTSSLTAFAAPPAWPRAQGPALTGRGGRSRGRRSAGRSQSTRSRLATAR